MRVSKNVSPVNPVLNRVAQDVELCQQPCRQHGKPVGAYEERDHQQPHAVADGIHEDDEQTEEAENGGGDAEDAAGQADNEHEKPCDDGKHREDGRKEDFQKETHINIPPVLFVSDFSIQEAALPCKDAGPQKSRGGLPRSKPPPTWDKYPIILWRQAGKGYRLPPARSAPDFGVYPPCPRRKRALFHAPAAQAD